MLYDYETIMTEFFDKNFTTISIQQLEYTNQMCQIIYHIGANDNASVIINLVWHHVDQKPYILYNDTLYAINADKDMPLKQVLSIIGFEQAIVKGINPLDDVDAMLAIPIYEVPLIQFMMFYDSEVFEWWHTKWVVQYDNAIQQYEEQIQAVNEQLLQYIQETTIENYEFPYSDVSSSEDEVSANESVTDYEDEHIAFHVAHTVLN